MPSAQFDRDPEQTEKHPNLEPQLDPKAPPKRSGCRFWVVLMMILLLMLAGVLFISARAQFNRDYERALNNIMMQQGNVVATLGSGK